jgi:hypothetical protein
VTWLNSRGAFAVWQQPERLHRPIRIGWLLLGLSLFLPSFRACNQTHVGWEVGYGCTLMQFEPKPMNSAGDVCQYVQLTLLNAANLLVLGSPLWARRLRRGGGQVYAAFLGCTATAAWTTAVPEAEGLLVGYYVWCLAQLCMLSAARPGARTLVAMWIVAALRVFLWPAKGDLPAEGAAERRPTLQTIASRLCVFRLWNEQGADAGAPAQPVGSSNSASVGGGRRRISKPQGQARRAPSLKPRSACLCCCRSDRTRDPSAAKSERRGSRAASCPGGRRPRDRRA